MLGLALYCERRNLSHSSRSSLRGAAALRANNRRVYLRDPRGSLLVKRRSAGATVRSLWLAAVAGRRISCCFLVRREPRHSGMAALKMCFGRCSRVVQAEAMHGVARRFDSCHRLSSSIRRALRYGRTTRTRSSAACWEPRVSRLTARASAWSSGLLAICAPVSRNAWRTISTDAFSLMKSEVM